MNCNNQHFHRQDCDEIQIVSNDNNTIVKCIVIQKFVIFKEINPFIFYITKKRLISNSELKAVDDDDVSLCQDTEPTILIRSPQLG